MDVRFLLHTRPRPPLDPVPYITTPKPDKSHRLKPGGLPPTLAGWETAVRPAQECTDHLVTNMYALDGAPRITHIWAFASLEEREALRAQAYEAGVWPPKGGPEQIVEATSTIALPQKGSPLA